VSTEPSVAAPPVSFELTFRPTGAEALQAQLSFVPRWLVHVGVFMIVVSLGNVSMRFGIPPLLALAGIVALGVAAPHLAYAFGSRETQLRIGAGGLESGPPGASHLAASETLLRVRVTKLVYLFTLRSGATVILPQRVLGGAERRVIEDALAARPALVTRKEPASLATSALWILGILVFVTVYNLFQTGRPPRPRQPKSGNTPTSSLRMPSSTDATGRSSFIEPTI